MKRLMGFFIKAVNGLVLLAGALLLIVGLGVYAKLVTWAFKYGWNFIGL